MKNVVLSRNAEHIVQTEKNLIKSKNHKKWITTFNTSALRSGSSQVMGDFCLTRSWEKRRKCGRKSGSFSLHHGIHIQSLAMWMSPRRQTLKKTSRPPKPLLYSGKERRPKNTLPLYPGISATCKHCWLPVLDRALHIIAFPKFWAVAGWFSHPQIGTSSTWDSVQNTVLCLFRNI